MVVVVVIVIAIVSSAPALKDRVARGERIECGNDHSQQHDKIKGTYNSVRSRRALLLFVVVVTVRAAHVGSKHGVHDTLADQSSHVQDFHHVPEVRLAVLAEALKPDANECCERRERQQKSCGNARGCKGNVVAGGFVPEQRIIDAAEKVVATGGTTKAFAIVRRNVEGSEALDNSSLLETAAGFNDIHEPTSQTHVECQRNYD
mmetsp:Transcript_25554/g.55983  ORF Transcript_25554/g.55983 Transcript_25554/m.55983 type:complete len:204 (+) Transcript_25554:1500-2111(+)